MLLRITSTDERLGWAHCDQMTVSVRATETVTCMRMRKQCRRTRDRHTLALFHYPWHIFLSRNFCSASTLLPTASMSTWCNTHSAILRIVTKFVSQINHSALWNGIKFPNFFFAEISEFWFVTPFFPISSNFVFHFNVLTPILPIFRSIRLMPKIPLRTRNAKMAERLVHNFMQYRIIFAASTTIVCAPFNWEWNYFHRK